MNISIRSCCPFCMQSLQRGSRSVMCLQGHYSCTHFDATVDECFIQNNSIFNVYYKQRKKRLDFRVSSLYICREDDTPIETFTKPQTFEQIKAHLARANRLMVMR